MTMTREEAIEQLQNCKGLIKQDGKDWLDERDIPLLDIAIEAISESQIIRCKDCRWAKRAYHQRKVKLQCRRIRWFVAEDSYCWMAERRKP